MGIFSFLKKRKISNMNSLTKKQSSSEKREDNHSDTESLSKTYSEMRGSEEQWLDSHYDLDTIEGIRSIPISNNLPGCRENGVTGELYYRLKQKSYEHEKNGNMELAETCMRKSIQLAKLKYDAKVIEQLEYTLIAMLARNGQIAEAEAEKEIADKEFIFQTKLENVALMRRTIGNASELKTDFVIAQVHAHASSEMAIYQGRVYSISGNSSKFPALPRYVLETGTLSNGEYFPVHPFLDGIDKGDLAYTLECNPIKCTRYARNIVTFSNRPFVDDRPEAYIAESVSLNAKYESERIKDEGYKAHIIQSEAEKGINQRNYIWIQENIPEKAPKSYSGYMRMKNGKTKNFLILQEMASKKGRII